MESKIPVINSFQFISNYVIVPYSRKTEIKGYVMHGLMHGEQNVATCNKICELCEENFGDDDIVTQRMESTKNTSLRWMDLSLSTKWKLS